MDKKLRQKQKLYSFQMVDNKSIVEKLTKYYKIIDDIQNIKVKLDGDN